VREREALCILGDSKEEVASETLVLINDGIGGLQDGAQESRRSKSGRPYCWRCIHEDEEM
jgi:hypothetical protein